MRLVAAFVLCSVPVVAPPAPAADTNQELQDQVRKTEIAFSKAVTYT